MILSPLAYVIARLPQSARDFVALAISWLVFTVLRIRRAEVEVAMARAELSGNARAFYRELAGRLIELLTVAGGAELGERSVGLTASARTALARAQEGGRPVVIAASHTGNWELAAFALAREHKVAVVAKRQGVSSANRFMNDLRARFGVTVLPTRGALALASACLAEGAIVVMPIDQAPDRPEHGDVVAFLGRDALVDRAPFVLAKRRGATVLVAACEGARVHVLDVLETRDLASPREAARRATLTLDAHVRAFPSSWLWLHRRWKNVPAQRQEELKKCSESQRVA